MTGLLTLLAIVLAVLSGRYWAPTDCRLDALPSEQGFPAYTRFRGPPVAAVETAERRPRVVPVMTR
jgi:hypothetical protein